MSVFTITRHEPLEAVEWDGTLAGARDIAGLFGPRVLVGTDPLSLMPTLRVDVPDLVAARTLQGRAAGSVLDCHPGELVTRNARGGLGVVPAGLRNWFVRHDGSPA